jgi:hypothetical protein
VGFSKEVREQALVASARHCCVCHRVNGVKVEVHHIEPRSEGGADEYDNAIVLCFDCHADAGHYNPAHPKGTKFSRSELKRARDEWYRLVREHKVEPLAKSPRLHCRYYLARQYEAILEIADGDLSNFPEDAPLLVETDVLKFLRKLIAEHPASYRHDYIFGDEYESLEEYLRKRPDADSIDKQDGRLSYFDTVRIPSYDELESRVSSKDSVSKFLLKEKAPIDEISAVVTYYEGCGGVPCQEKFLVRPLNLLFITARNITDSVLTLDALVGEVNLTSMSYRRFASRASSTHSYSLPKAPIAPGETVVVPIALVLSPFHSWDFIINSSAYKELSPGVSQTVSHAKMAAGELEQFSTIGPTIMPRAISIADSHENEDIHPVDLSNLYVISRDWAMGSCPHLFTYCGEWAYLGEVLAKSMGVSGESVIRVAEGTIKILIAELEEEVTLIEAIIVDGKCVVGERTLEQGDALEVVLDSPAPEGGMSIVIRGFYVPIESAKGLRKDVVRRNTLVCQHLRHLKGLKAQPGTSNDLPVAARLGVG